MGLEYADNTFKAGMHLLFEHHILLLKNHFQSLEVTDICTIETFKCVTGNIPYKHRKALDIKIKKMLHAFLCGINQFRSLMLFLRYRTKALRTSPRFDFDRLIPFLTHSFCERRSISRHGSSIRYTSVGYQTSASVHVASIFKTP